MTPLVLVESGMSRKSRKRNALLTKEQQAVVDAFNAQVLQQRMRAAEALAAGKPVEASTLTLTMKTDGTKIEVEVTRAPQAEGTKAKAKHTRRRRTGRSQSIWTMRG